MIANIPRIVYFEENFHEITFINRWYILWPCYAWKVAIPVRDKTCHLNPFEELVLKLSDQGLRTKEGIANYCYETPEGNEHEELIFCVQSRLMVRGYLDSRYEITNEGKKLLDIWDSERIEYKSAIVYQDWDSGKLLPAVYFGIPEYPEIIPKEQGKINFRVDDSERGKKYAQIINIAEKKELPDPSPAEVIQAFYNFINRRDRYGFLRQKTSILEQPKVKLNFNEIPRIQEREPVYLYCQILYREDGNFLVSDGFGLGYSDSFLKYLIKNEDSLLTKLRVPRDKASKDDDEDSSEPGRGENKFFSISAILTGTREMIQIWKNEGSLDSDDANLKRKIEKQNAVKSLYNTLELSFTSLCVKYPAYDWIDKFSNAEYGQYSEMIKSTAYQLGFSVTNDNSYLLEAPPGSFNEIRKNMKELQVEKLKPILILAIMAASDNKFHPCNTLANDFPDFLDFARELLNIKNPLMHGNYSDEIPIDKVVELYEKTCKAIGLILPEELPKDMKEQALKAVSLDYFREKRLQADYEFAELFGNEMLYSMDSNLRFVLYELKIYKVDDDSIVNNMYKALQNVLYSLVKAHSDLSKQEYAQWMEGFSSELSFDSTVDAVRNYAQETAIKYGLLAQDEELPPVIKDVSERRIPAALRGRDISLQANCLALLAVGSDYILSFIQKTIPDLVKFTARLADMRGKGIAVKIGNANLDDMEKKLLNIIKELLEVTYGNY